MSMIAPINANADTLIRVSQERVEVRNEFEQYPPAPASALAVPVETARSQVNMIAMMPALMAPTPDGIFTIGAVSVKSPGRITAIKLGASSWGF